MLYTLNLHSVIRQIYFNFKSQLKKNDGDQQEHLSCFKVLPQPSQWTPQLYQNLCLHLKQDPGRNWAGTWTAINPPFVGWICFSFM